MEFQLLLRDISLLITVLLMTFCDGEYCFKKYMTNKSVCRRPMKRHFRTAADCCNKGGLGYATQQEKVGKRIYTCSSCRQMTQQKYHKHSKWLEWSGWSACSKTCGNAGMRERTRKCHGHKCTATSTGTQTCTTDIQCPVDGMWGSWQAWEACSVSCGGGEHKRVRACDSPSPAHAGRYCEGFATGKQTCNSQHCPVDGGWGAWSSYSECSKTCGEGMYTRTRKCDTPAPQHGGKYCPQHAFEKKPCHVRMCPVDGQWSNWGGWGLCSKSCGAGDTKRTRLCDRPAPAFGGKPCPGQHHQTQPCNIVHCPVDGGWCEWQNWTPCTASCDEGFQTRPRTCGCPKAQHGGRRCIGEPMEIRTCENVPPCPAMKKQEEGSSSECSDCESGSGSGGHDGSDINTDQEDDYDQSMLLKDWSWYIHSRRRR